MRLTIPILLLLVYWLAGCAGGSATTKNEPSAMLAANKNQTLTDEGATASGDESATASGVSEGETYQGDPLNNPDSPLANKVFYFKFDSDEIQEDDRPSIEAHGDYLAKHPNIKVSLEGHTDERGSREYNLALGERRANAVRRLLLLMGASEEQVKVVSYGEERPAVEGYDEGAWQLNRRVEIIYP
ncbi:peptidoglycan-associated lipoprotein [Candidatus Nitrosoglobus terrae]|uniref:Peptidoglycan-associated lipoprotein n=1 Tax=Candidatus Nitrosoglobus terrae TaxID=1630141 RepID=A0A1Q2SK31_9GAMM|nr:peptidoglycan-associated lipoprotein Pal [Candidatus Nitrosoglobus terrae]BAW79472.1 peptidoglycan-associated lipoprotein [Candidatus Nitrosoglobus terrae]